MLKKTAGVLSLITTHYWSFQLFDRGVLNDSSGVREESMLIDQYQQKYGKKKTIDTEQEELKTDQTEELFGIIVLRTISREMT